MVVGTSTVKMDGDAAAVQQPQQPQQPAPGLVGGIDNIMSGIGNTGTVKMNNHRKKLRQRWVDPLYGPFKTLIVCIKYRF